MGKHVTAVGSWGTRNFIGEKFDFTIGNLILNLWILLDISMNTLVTNFHCKKFTPRFSHNSVAEFICICGSSHM